MTTRHTGPGPTRQHIRTAKDRPMIVGTEVVERTVQAPALWPAVPAGVIAAVLIEGVIHFL